MPVYYSFLAAAMPMLFYLFVIWKFDKYDREPASLVLRNFMWGAVGAVIFAFIGNTIFETLTSGIISDKKTTELLGTIIGAPFIEELTKGLFLVLTLTDKKFDNITDGIVYGGAIGLGFGMTENFLYFLNFGKDFESWLGIVIIRTFFSAVMHCIAAASFGAFAGYAKYKSPLIKISLIPVGFAIAVIIHFTWNLAVTFQNTFTAGVLFMLTVFSFLAAAYGLSLRNERTMIYRELTDEAQNGLIPFEDLPLLVSPDVKSFGNLGRKKTSAYKKYAVTLAFRKEQSSTSSGLQKQFCLTEIEKLRNSIQSVLETQNGK
jgi:RsiW-degrading membrane proteinase PrsW (M82 family)